MSQQRVGMRACAKWLHAHVNSRVIEGRSIQFKFFAPALRGGTGDERGVTRVKIIENACSSIVATGDSELIFKKKRAGKN